MPKTEYNEKQIGHMPKTIKVRTHMPRPKKCRTVCCMPSTNRFGPLDPPADSLPIIFLALDEYETIRLIDLEGLNQEACAEQMGIARTTVQRMYNDARKKMAMCLVNGQTLCIQGGDVRLCGGTGRRCCHAGCRKRLESPKDES